MAEPCNIEALKAAFGPYALPRTGVPNLVASKCKTFDNFLKSAELHVYIDSNHTPRNTSLDTIEITLHEILIEAFLTARSSELEASKGLLRISMAQRIGEFILTHVLLCDGIDQFISTSIDLARSKEARGNGLAAEAIFGGKSTFGWPAGKLRILFRRDNKVYRIPYRVLGDLYHNVKVCAFNVEELDL
jgi:hypothetical protein